MAVNRDLDELGVEVGGRVAAAVKPEPLIRAGDQRIAGGSQCVVAPEDSKVECPANSPPKLALLSGSRGWETKVTAAIQFRLAVTREQADAEIRELAAHAFDKLDQSRRLFQRLTAADRETRDLNS